MDRIIFLDIDGVLLSERAWAQPENKALLDDVCLWERHSQSQAVLERAVFDPEAVDLVNQLAKRAEAKIVISSNWRITYRHAPTLKKVLDQGIREDLMHPDAPICPGEIDTGMLMDIAWKREGIRSWLARHRCDLGVILDDDVLFPGSDSQTIFQVRTTFENGFDRRAYNEACKVFGIRKQIAGSHDTNSEP